MNLASSPAPQVGPISDSVAQFGAFADIVASERLLSPIVSITPSEPVAINPEAAGQGLGTATDAPADVAVVLLVMSQSHQSSPGLFLSVPISDQGDPSDPARSLGIKANCDAAVQNLAVFSIDNEDDNDVSAAGRCVGDLNDGLCSCKFTVPHFSAFAVVDTSPAAVAPPSAQSSAASVALGLAAAVASAFVLL